MATKGDFNGTVTVRPLAYWIGWSSPQFRKIVDNRYVIVEPRRLGKRLVTLVFWRDFFLLCILMFFGLSRITIERLW